MKILIADDDLPSRLVLELTLRKLGHEVTSNGDGGEAWAACQRAYYPIIISDWLMPDLDGLDLCRRLRASPSGRGYTYVILLTMMDGKQNYLKGIDAGADDLLTKPFDEAQLAARLHVAGRIVRLQDHVRRLEGLLPICAYCKQIRDGADTWTPVEQYIARRADVDFSHGFCPGCYRRHVEPEMRRLGIEPPQMG